MANVRRIPDPLAGVKQISEDSPPPTPQLSAEVPETGHTEVVRASEKRAQVPASLAPSQPAPVYTVTHKTRVCFRGQLLFLHPGEKYSDALYGDGAIACFRASRAPIVEIKPELL